MKRILIGLLLGLISVSIVSAQGPDSTTFVMDDGSLSFDYPEDWHADFQGIQIVVTNNPELLEVSNRLQLSDGDVMLIIFGANETSEIGIESASSSMVAIEQLHATIEQRATVGNITDLASANDKSVHSFDFGNENTEGLYITLEAAPERILTMVALTTPGNLSDIEGDVLAIVKSVEYDADSANADEIRVIQEMSIGPDDAPVTIYEFGSYGCHACRLVHEAGVVEEILGIVERFEGDVRFVFVNFPVISPHNDPVSAEVSQCLADQSNDLFWEFHEAMYALSDAEYAQETTYQDFVDIGLDLGADEEQLNDCVNQRTHRGTVQYNLNRSIRQGVQGTPTFFVNDTRLRASAEQIEQQVLQELTAN
jgi:protein-disulfide isomerase